MTRLFGQSIALFLLLSTVANKRLTTLSQLSTSRIFLPRWIHFPGSREVTVLFVESIALSLAYQRRQTNDLLRLIAASQISTSPILLHRRDLLSGKARNDIIHSIWGSLSPKVLLLLLRGSDHKPNIASTSHAHNGSRGLIKGQTAELCVTVTRKGRKEILMLRDVEVLDAG